MQVKVSSHHSLQILKRIDSESSQSCQLARDIASYSEIIANLIHIIELVLKPLFFYCSTYSFGHVSQVQSYEKGLVNVCSGHESFLNLS